MPRSRNIQYRTLAGLLWGLLVAGPVAANPVGSAVVHGQAAFARPDARTLNITNSPGAVIHWQGFGIGAGETTRFLQQGPSSAVLNRVVGGDPSRILGSLLSNGQVFLINPNGVLFGRNAVVNTAGLIASTLNMSDADFIAGRLRFDGADGAGVIENQGYIKAGPGGRVLLVAPRITNRGVIETEGGELMLAAGERLTITDLDDTRVTFEVQAPDNEVVNLGRLMAHGGAASVFAGTIRHSGVVSADGLRVDAQGRVQLVASGDVDLAPGSRVSADGPRGGTVQVESRSGTTLAAGEISARGGAGEGGEVRLLGQQVGLVGDVRIDVSGRTGGGTALIGGDYRGRNPGVPNARATFAGSGTAIHADAIGQGDGGRVIVWADEATRAFGAISARGGPDGGNGGLVETSGRQLLDIGDAVPDLSAPAGEAGRWLLDPHNVTFITPTAGAGTLDGQTPNFSANADSSTINVGAVNGALDAGTAVTVDTGVTGAVEPGNIDFAAGAAIQKSTGANTSLTLSAANDILIGGGGITTSLAGTLDLILNADSDASGAGTVNFIVGVTTNGGSITATAGSGIQVSGGATLSSGGGAVSLTTGGGDVLLQDSGNISSIDSLGGAASLTASAGQVIVQGGSGVLTGNGAASLTAQTTVDIQGFINTGTGVLTLASTGGNISAGAVSIGTAGGNVLLQEAGNVSSIDDLGVISSAGQVIVLGEINSLPPGGSVISPAEITQETQVGAGNGQPASFSPGASVTVTVTVIDPKDVIVAGAVPPAQSDIAASVSQVLVLRSLASSQPAPAMPPVIDEEPTESEVGQGGAGDQGGWPGYSSPLSTILR